MTLFFPAMTSSILRFRIQCQGQGCHGLSLCMTRNSARLFSTLFLDWREQPKVPGNSTVPKFTQCLQMVQYYSARSTVVERSIFRAVFTVRQYPANAKEMPAFHHENFPIILILPTQQLLKSIHLIIHNSC